MLNFERQLYTMVEVFHVLKCKNEYYENMPHTSHMKVKITQLASIYFCLHDNFDN